MGWTAVIMAIWQILGPILTDLIKKWLEGLFQKVAEKMPAADVYGTDRDRRLSLVDAAIRATPRMRVLKRGFLHRLRSQLERDDPSITVDDLPDFDAVITQMELQGENLLAP